MQHRSLLSLAKRQKRCMACGLMIPISKSERNSECVQQGHHWWKKHLRINNVYSTTNQWCSERSCSTSYSTASSERAARPLTMLAVGSHRRASYACTIHNSVARIRYPFCQFQFNISSLRCGKYSFEKFNDNKDAVGCFKLFNGPYTKQLHTSWLPYYFKMKQ